MKTDDGYEETPKKFADDILHAPEVEGVIPSPQELAKSIKSKRKVHVSMLIDAKTVEVFRAMAKAYGVGYQTLMNEALAQYAQAWLASDSSRDK